MAGTERLVDFPAKTTPVGADIVYVGDSADAYNEVQSTITQIIAGYSAALASIAGLTTASNKMIYTTASNTYATADLSPFARTYLDDTSSASMLATIGALPLAGGTMTGDLILNADPTDLLGAATKQYVDASVGAPSGPAGGDLSGTYPDPAVAKINGATLGTATATSGNLLIGSGSAWVTQALTGNVTITSGGVTTIGALQITNGMIAASTIDLTTKVTGVLPGTNGGTGVNNGSSTFTIGGNTSFVGAHTFAGTVTANTAVTFPTSGTLVNTAGSGASGTWSIDISGNASTVTTNANLTGDVTSVGNATTLATVNSNVGSFGDSTHVGAFTVNAKGQITAASSVTITGAAPTGAAGGDLSGTYPDPTVAKINGVALGTTTATAGNLLIGSGSDWVTNAVSGNVTISSSGVTTIGASQVTNSMLAGSIDLTAKVTGILPSANGGTGVAYFAVSGPASTLKTYTFPNASCNVLTDNATVTAAQGGTGNASYTTGDLIQASAGTTLSPLAAVAAGNALISGGVGTVSSWGKIGLTTHVSGILPGANGGTGNGFFAISGPATSLKTYTLPNATCNILTDNAVISPAQGGTGVANNAASTITISGSFATTLTVTGATNVTLPTSGTLTTLATVVGTQNNFTKAQSVTPVAVTSSANHIATDASLSNVFTHTLTENTTLDNPTNLVAGTYYTWIIIQAASAKTLAYGNKFKWPGGTAMTVSTASGAVDIITSYYDGTNLNSVFSQAFA